MPHDGDIGKPFHPQMTTIRRQSIISMAFIYAGFLIGALNVLVLFPKYFSPAEFGLTRLLLEISLLLSTLCTAGMVPVSIKFFPFHKKYLPDRKNDLFFLTGSIVALALLLMVVVLNYTQPWIIRKFGYKSPLFVEYYHLLYPLMICMTLFSFFEAYAWITGKSIWSNFLKEFLFRFLTTALIIGWIVGWMTGFSLFATLFSFSYLPPLLLLIYVVNRTGQIHLAPKVSSVTRRLGGKMTGFGFAFFLSASLNALAKTNDTIILASQSSGGLTDAAVYAIATYLITLLEVPQRSLTAAATPQIAVAWKERNFGRLSSIYQKTALNLLIIGLGLICLILLNIDELVIFLGPDYAPISSIILILGLAKLIDLGTGMNSQILLLSKHWKIDMVSNVLFVVASLFLNYYLTKAYGVKGPAYGGLLAILVFNLIRFLAIWKIYHLQPFTINNLKAILIAVACFGLSYLVPDLGNIYLNVVVRSFAFFILFSAAILQTRISVDVNEVYANLLKRFSSFKF
jgi:O-antigen/teichoic acid export membrane protein